MSNLVGFKTYQAVHRSKRDHAPKEWLAEQQDEARGMQMFVGMLLIGALAGLALYDWSQGMEWARALVAMVYRSAPL